jgi:hypothetical protein
MVLLWLLLFSHLTFAECPAGNPMEPSQMTPEGVKAWLAGRTDKIKTVGDYICCLPPKYLKGYFISHASIAGQNGSPESPRVILNDEVRQFSTEQNVMLISVNGGAEYLSQKDSAEFMFYRKSAKRLELYDASKEHGRFALSGKNPGLCMSCHGEGSELEPKHGPHPIFDPFGNWPRFVGGGLKCFAEEDKVQIHQQRMALEAIRDNPRFRCLDRTKLEEDIKNLSLAEDNFERKVQSIGTLEGLDSFLFEVNNQRIVRVVRDTPDYDAYKYVIVAEQWCDISAEIEEWIPPAALSNHNRMSSVKPEFTRVESAEQIKELIASAKLKAKEYREEFKKNLSATMADRKSGLNPTSLPFVCDKPSDTEDDIEITPQFASDIKNPILRSYKIDSLFRRKPLEIRGGTSGTQRFLFEARGIDMASWGLEPTLGEYRIKNEIAEDLIRAESKSTPLGKLYAERARRIEKESSKKSGPPNDEIEAWFCKQLKDASYKALLKLKPTGPVQPAAKTAR